MARERVRIPLLRDSHTHPLLYAAFMDGIDLGADPAETREQAIERIRSAAVAGDPGWLIAYGWNSGRYLITRQDLEKLPPVAVLNLSLHGLVVNDAGLDLLRRHDPAVVENLSDQAWIEANLRRVLNVFIRGESSPHRLRRFYRWLLREHGVHHAEEMLLADEQEIGLFDATGLAGRTRFWAAPEDYDRLPRELKSRVHGVKLFADGALGSWSAALKRPYRDRQHSGLLMYEQTDLERLLAKHVAQRAPVAVHAIGDRALEQVVSALEAAGCSREDEIRIEHAQFITESQSRRAKAMGIRLCMQPNFSSDSTHYSDRLPEGYPRLNNPFRMLIDRVGFVPGDDLLFGSDGMPHGFREGLKQSLFPPNDEQRLSLEEFAAGYCLPDETAGHIDVEIDHASGQVSGHVVTAVGAAGS